MSTTYHLGCCFSLVLCMCCNLAMAEVAIDHNSTRSNRGTAVGGGGDTTDTDLAIGNDKIVRKKPGRTTYANITLERGYTATDDLWQWRKNIEDGKIDRRAGSVIILDQDGTTEVARYNFFEAWPCKWNVPELDSDSSAMAIEKIELAVEKVERA